MKQNHSPIRLSVATIAMHLVVSLALVKADDTNQQDVIKKMRDVYSNAITYEDSGTVETLVTMAGISQTLVKPFKIKFHRHQSITIEWTSSFGGLKDPYVLHSNTNGTITYNRRINQIKKEQSLEYAINTWTGVSGGSVRNVPCMLLNVMKQPQYDDLTDLKNEGNALIEKTDCYKITAKRRDQPVTIWIGRKDYLLRKLSIDTRFGLVTELHREIRLNEKVEDNAVSFSPPDNAKIVDRFRYGGEILGTTESGRENKTGP